MKRNINIISNTNISSINSFENIHIDNIENLIDCSIDNIIISLINYLDKNKSKNILQSLLSKIRPQGSLTVSFIDIKLICQTYLDNKMSNHDLLLVLKNIENVVNLDELLTYIDMSKFRITSINRQKENIIVSITRTVP